MSIDATRWAWTRRGLRPAAKLVLLALADRAGADDCAYPSRTTIQQDTCLDRKSVAAAINALLSRGFIEDSGERKGVTKRVVVYKMVGVEHRTVDEIGPKTEQFQKRADLPNRPKNDHLNRPKNGHLIGPKTGLRTIRGTIKEQEGRASAPRATEVSSRKNVNGTRNAFCPPTLDEIRVYARETGTLGCASAFHDHFESNGWRVGRGGLPMKDWRAAYRAWHRRQDEFNGGGGR